jgi:hypothetical protein
MGTWGLGNFENDDALDWVFELEQAKDLAPLGEALDVIVESHGDYLDAYDCARALAAAEVVAALAGKPDPSLPEEVRNWLSGRPGVDAAMRNRARQAVAAIMDSSELRELWEETDESDQWQHLVSGLLQRLI